MYSNTDWLHVDKKQNEIPTILNCRMNLRKYYSIWRDEMMAFEKYLHGLLREHFVDPKVERQISIILRLYYWVIVWLFRWKMLVTFGGSVTSLLMIHRSRGTEVRVKKKSDKIFDAPNEYISSITWMLYFNLKYYSWLPFI